ncbi:MAG: DUF2786 domain-containing protein [Rhodocyclaceae bacterium]|nr:DUF2786 domain-containing protein [Rhodocyclaceae bacterium]
MKNDQQKALDKIKKCLKLSGSSNANEAATALRQAQALMEKYNVDYTDVLAAECGHATIPSSVKAKPTAWESYLANKAAQAFSCKFLLTSSIFDKKANWKFIGVGSSPELAAYAFNVLFRQVKRDRAEYIKTTLKRCKAANKTKRADLFCEAWVYLAGEKIAAIAPSKDAQLAITAYMQKHHSKAGEFAPRQPKKTNSQSSYADSHAGINAGKSAVLNRGMTGTAAATALEHQQ